MQIYQSDNAGRWYPRIYRRRRRQHRDRAPQSLEISRGERRGGRYRTRIQTVLPYLDLHVILGTTGTGHGCGDLFGACCGPCGKVGSQDSVGLRRPSSFGEQINVQRRSRHACLSRGGSSSGLSSASAGRIQNDIMMTMEKYKKAGQTSREQRGRQVSKTLLKRDRGQHLILKDIRMTYRHM